MRSSLLFSTYDDVIIAIAISKIKRSAENGEREKDSHNISIGCINYYSYSTVSSFYIIIYIYYI